MILSFQMDQDDYADFLRQATRRIEAAGKIRNRLSWIGWAYWFCPALAVVAFYYFISEGHIALSGHFYAALGFLLAGAGIGTWYRRAYQRLWSAHFCSANGFFCLPQKFSIDDGGVTIERPGSVQRYQWSAFHAFTESDRLLFLQLDVASALCIPRRALSAEVSAQVVAAITRHVGTAHVT